MSVVGVAVVTAASLSSAFDVVPGPCRPLHNLLYLSTKQDLINNKVDIFAEGNIACLQDLMIQNCHFCSELVVHQYNPATNKYDIYIDSSKKSFTLECADSGDLTDHVLKGVPMVKGKEYRGRHNLWHGPCDKVGVNEKPVDFYSTFWTW
jgi:hypothetical protein